MTEGIPQRQDRAAAGRAADIEFVKGAKEEALRKDLEELDAKIGPLRARLRAGEDVSKQLEPLLDRRGALVQAIEETGAGR